MVVVFLMLCSLSWKSIVKVLCSKLNDWLFTESPYVLIKVSVKKVQSNQCYSHWVHCLMFRQTDSFLHCLKFWEKIECFRFLVDVSQDLLLTDLLTHPKYKIYHAYRCGFSVTSGKQIVLDCCICEDFALHGQEVDLKLFFRELCLVWCLFLWHKLRKLHNSYIYLSLLFICNNCVFNKDWAWIFI